MLAEKKEIEKLTRSRKYIECWSELTQIRLPRKSIDVWNVELIPNTAVFGPTKLIGTTTTARMKISDDEDF